MREVAEKVLHWMQMREKLKYFSNEEIVKMCLETDAAENEIVCEMMDRLYPGWWHE